MYQATNPWILVFHEREEASSASAMIPLSSSFAGAFRSLPRNTFFSLSILTSGLALKKYCKISCLLKKVFQMPRANSIQTWNLINEDLWIQKATPTLNSTKLKQRNIFCLISNFHDFELAKIYECDIRICLFWLFDDVMNIHPSRFCLKQ